MEMILKRTRRFFLWLRWAIQARVTYAYYWTKGFFKNVGIELSTWFRYKRVIVFGNTAENYVIADVKDKRADLLQYIDKSFHALKQQDPHLTPRSTLAMVIDFRKKKVGLYKVGEILSKGHDSAK